MKKVFKYKTIVISDVHLGTPDCKIDEVNHFLKHTESDLLILNGDIIDGWSLGRKGGWTLQHTRFIRLILKKIEKKNTKVVYLRGNHDDILDRFLPLEFGSMKVVDHYVYDNGSMKYLIVHGDVFDTVTQHSKLIAVLGDIGYQGLLKINRVYNRYRQFRGRPYFSLSKAIKAKTKQVVSYISKFEDQVEEFSERFGCEGFICGHIHTPEDKFIGKIRYLNSGDWVESCTALVENFSGQFGLLTYDEFCENLGHKAEKSGEKE